MTTETQAPAAIRDDGRKGFVMVLVVYVIWGFMPLYMKALGHIPPLEFLANRVIWAVPVAGMLLVLRGRLGDITTALRSPRMLAMALLTATLISINTGTYLWAVSVGRALEGAMGYFINPLLNVLLGAIFLKEKLSVTQLAAVGLAAVAVVILTIDAGHIPWVAITMALSWGFYSFFRKTLPIGPNQGFFLEVLLLAIVALPYMIWLETSGQGHLLNGQPGDVPLLLSIGLITAIPLMIFAAGAKMLPLSTVGIMQYITPTIIFLIAVFVFHEPLSLVKLGCFALIWTALLLYTVSMLLQLRGR
ncbi:EamA family transporter RarD [Rhizobium sp. XQZ8]|uniref:EamA family transporter RarD n=1 Tax=Rhizobium populisoli TaxID=2859785 RepID=UPI001CA4F801|nr:EamA family transporter RarD [Rhizobium populisoli]MBW6420581.1 EamA family transporter RarD [Rhizobium populisoli]